TDAEKQDDLNADQHQDQLEGDRLRALSGHQDQGAANEDGSESGQHGTSPMPVRDIKSDLVEVQGHRDEHQTREGRGTAAHHEEVVVPAGGVERHRDVRRRVAGPPTPTLPREGGGEPASVSSSEPASSAATIARRP